LRDISFSAASDFIVMEAQFTIGVGQPDRSEEETLADVRRADARSAQISRPEGVARGFHVS
jgi:hypothetical protein